MKNSFLPHAPIDLKSPQPQIHVVSIIPEHIGLVRSDKNPAPPVPVPDAAAIPGTGIRSAIISNAGSILFKDIIIDIFHNSKTEYLIQTSFSGNPGT